MTLLFILSLLILAIIFLILKRLKMCGFTLMIMLIGFVIMGNGTLPRLLLKPLEAPYNLELKSEFSQGKNAIVILGGGLTEIPGTDIVKPKFMAYSRIYQGLQLYQSCKKSEHKCTIIISGGNPFSSGISEALVYKNELLKFNVQEMDIETESESMNTYKNAELTSQYLKKQNFEHVFLVTSGVHMRRASLYFSHFGIKTIPVISDYITARISFLPSAYNFVMTDMALREYMGILRYYIYNLFGWNAKGRTSGYP
ncbi:MAG TPA: YdcF family protein [Gammaproteobacteria bacterium]|nr:YdcF family protein [Gammaproteobacteria bacterium]